MRPPEIAAGKIAPDQHDQAVAPRAPYPGKPAGAGEILAADPPGKPVGIASLS
jgi:hypothetical protein